MCLQKAFVLHARPYRETSMLIELFTEKAGRIGAVARGGKKKKSALLQPFVPLMVDWGGKGELVTLKTIETDSMPLRLSPSILPSAFYLNELLLRVLHWHDPHEYLFEQYANTLRMLDADNLEPILRRFEKTLLQEIGYGLHITHDVEGNSIQPDGYYRFMPHHGCVRGVGTDAFLGAQLLSIASEDYSDSHVLASAKRLMRLAFKPLLGDKPVKSRELYGFQKVLA
jgi:DNA repair protein RecO (recombination protein O)